jgi:hypothetical protein
MIADTMRSHKMGVFSMKKDRVTEFESEIVSYCLDHCLHIKDYVHYHSKITFSLIARSIEEIELFLSEFAPKWSINEMGVSQFARIMGVSDSEADAWYSDIDKHQGSVINMSNFENKLVGKMCKITDVKNLEYLRDHFMGNMKEHIQSRIDHLEGKEDPYIKWMERQVERQALLESLIDSSLIDASMLERLKLYISNT